MKVKWQQQFILSFFNNSEVDVEIKSFSTDIAGRVEMHDVRVSDDIDKNV